MILAQYHLIELLNGVFDVHELEFQRFDALFVKVGDITHAFYFGIEIGTV